MDKKWEWKNKITDERMMHSSPVLPPNREGEWIRVFSIGVGRVPGAGGSPARVSRRVDL